jgi:hypothetical protein
MSATDPLPASARQLANEILVARAEDLDLICAYEAAVTDAHLGYTRLPKGAISVFEQTTADLTDLVAGPNTDTGERLLIHLQFRVEAIERFFEGLAFEFEGLGALKTLPASRRPFIVKQAERFRELAAGGHPRHYYGVRFMDRYRKRILADRAASPAV